MKQNVNHLPEASTVLIFRGGKILAIGRKNDSTDFGLLGGKREPGESAKAAAARESLEEAGITVADLVELYSDEDAGKYFVITFFVGRYYGEPRDMGQGNVEWVTEGVLYAGRWSGYNRAVVAAYRAMFPQGKETVAEKR